MTPVTEEQARAAAALIPGINVRRWKGTWHYEVRFHARGGKWKRRYAGKSLKRAVELRIDLIATYGAQVSEQPV